MSFFLQSDRKTKWETIGTPSPGQYNPLKTTPTQKFACAPFGSTQPLLRMQDKQQKKKINPQPFQNQEDKLNIHELSKHFRQTDNKSSFFKSNTERFRQKPNEQLPGPGQYTLIQSIKHHSKSHILINNQKNTLAKPSVPSIPIDNLGFKQDQHNSMKKVQPPQYIQPHPGSYQISKKLQAKGVLSWKGQHKIQKEKEELPGPGDYNVLLKQSKSLSACFNSTADRFGIIKKVKQQKAPGPGAYNVQKIKKLSHNMSSKQYFNSKTSRFNREKSQSSHLGPGMYFNEQIKSKSTNQIKRYDPTRQDQTIAVKSANRSSMFNINDKNPGPGQYRTNFGMAYQLHKELLRKQAPVVLPKQKRQIFTHREWEAIPGPGAYDPKVQTKVKGKIWKKPKVINLKQEQPQSSPSPMEYTNLHNTIQSKIKKSNSKLQLTEQKPFNVGSERFKHYSNSKNHQDSQLNEYNNEKMQQSPAGELITSTGQPKKTKRLVMTTIKVKVPFGVSSNKYQQKQVEYNGPDFYSKPQTWIKPSYNIRGKLQ